MVRKKEVNVLYKLFSFVLKTEIILGQTQAYSTRGLALWDTVEMVVVVGGRGKVLPTLMSCHGFRDHDRA